MCSLQDAAPYVPGQEHSTAATTQPQPSSAGAKGARQDSLHTQDSAAFPPLTANQETQASTVPSTSAKQEAKLGGCPADMLCLVLCCMSVLTCLTSGHRCESEHLDEC